MVKVRTTRKHRTSLNMLKSASVGVRKPVRRSVADKKRRPAFHPYVEMQKKYMQDVMESPNSYFPWALEDIHEGLLSFEADRRTKEATDDLASQLASASLAKQRRVIGRKSGPRRSTRK